MTREEGKKLIEQAMKEIPFITCEQYLDLSRGGSDVVLLDVREQHEWEAGHMEDAVHITRGRLEMEVEREIPDKHQPIVLYCRAGGRAALGAVTLLQLGYTDIRYLQGGYDDYCKMKVAERNGA